MSLADRRWLRLFTLCVLYVAQGIPWGFTATTIPAYLSSHGLAPAVVGTTLAMTTLPYSFKWIWGPIIDAFTLPRFGRRRPWIVFAQGMMGLTILAMIAIPDLTLDLKMLAWMILIHTVFNSLQDVAVDALGVDLLPEAERGRANGLMYASKYLGGILGGGGMATVIAYAGLSTALIVQGAILFAIMLVPLLVRERDGVTPERPKLRVVMRSLAKVMSVRSALVTAVLMLVATFALGVLTANGFTLFTQQLHWSMEKLTQLTGGIGLAIGLAGAVLGGFFADWFGRKRVIAVASLAMAAGWLVFALGEAQWANDAFVYPLALWEALTTAVMVVALYALCMDVAWPKIGASQFTAYMSLSNISMTFGFRFTGALPSSWSYRDCYLAAVVTQVVITGLLLLIDPTQTRRSIEELETGPVPLRGIVATIALLALFAGFTIYVLAGIL